MLIAQISDCHIVSRDEVFADRVDSAAGLVRAIETIRALDLQPDLVLATGDLVASTSHPTTLPDAAGDGDVLDGYDACMSALTEQDPRAPEADVRALLDAPEAAGDPRADVLLRASELALMAEPGHMIALWERMYALEALGRHAALPGAMRDIIESYPQGSGVRLFENQVARMQADEELQRDPEAFFALGLADLLRGRFRESAGLFQQGLVFVDEASDPHPAARLLAWQARALLLSGLDDAGPRCKALLQRAVALTPDDPLLNLRLETMP